MTLDAAVAALARGEVVGVPTDTVYGLAIDPFDPTAMARLFEIKGRPADRPIGLLVATRAQAEVIAVIDGVAADLADRHWPGGLTLVVTPKVILSDWVGDSQRRTVGLRVPDHEATLELLDRAGPLAVTSANRSNEPEVVDDAGARAIFGDEVAVYLPGESPGGVASTVVDATGPEVVVLREGAVALG